MKLNEDEALRVFLANPTEENALSVCKAMGIARVGEKLVSEIDRLHLENARLRSRRICGTCEGSGAAVYSFGEPSATPWEVADAVPSWVEWQTAQSYPYAAVISSPWTWWEDGGARCQFCRHCGGTGWVEAVTR